MKSLIILITLLFALTANAEVLVYSPNGKLLRKTTITSANTAVDGAGNTVVITGPLSLTANITLATDRAWEFKKGAVITTTGYTFNENGASITAGDYQIFAGTGTVTGMKYVTPLWFGAVGNGTADDTMAIQAAINSISAGGTVDFGGKSYRIARNAGSHDRYGVTITKNNIVLDGNGATIRRYNTDISTYTYAYAPFFVGVPDNDAGAQTENVTIKNFNFVGENTRHDSNGDYINDHRNMITVKNTKGLSIDRCKFTKIDSASIYFQAPVDYDYVNAVYYNTTKNYKAAITNCEFIADAHSVVGRALVHAICLQGVDNCLVTDNYFEWCDDCAAGEGRYNLPTDVETDTYTPTNTGWASGDVKRVGRWWTFSRNRIKNSSEHAIYFNGMDITVTDNVLWSDAPDICNGTQIKIRSRDAVVSNNTVSNVTDPISIDEPSMYVVVSNNNLYLTRSSTSGAIDINSDTLSLFISSRDWHKTDGSPDYQPMQGITITGNNIRMQSGTATGEQNSAIRIYTASSDANYPQGQIRDVVIANNNIKNHYIGVYLVNTLLRNVSIIGNTFTAKEFTESGFAAGTTMNTLCAIGSYYTSTTAMSNVSFKNNTVKGSSYLFSDIAGTGSAGTMDLPMGISGNKFDFIKNIKTAAFGTVGRINNFSNNNGNFFLDRTWSGAMTGNALADGTLPYSSYKYNFAYGTHLVFYTDDAATSIQLDNEAP